MIEDAPTVRADHPEISDYELIRCISDTLYGQIWLARSIATQRFRAVKIVYRNRFRQDRPYETEFEGVRRFEEVSREHAGFVDILHVSRDDDQGYFLYVMELADDTETGQQIEPLSYSPRTLAADLARQGRLDPEDCLKTGISISKALEALASCRLAHRDIKPSNIVFVRGVPKLADVGLITDVRTEDGPLVGSPPYMDAEVHGSTAGDLYSFGKLLYVMATGQPPNHWPQPAREPARPADLTAYAELRAVYDRACAGDRRARYASAEEIHGDLVLLQTGQSMRRLQKLERFAKVAKRYGISVVALVVLLGLVLGLWNRQRQQAEVLLRREVDSYVAYGSRAMQDRDLAGALPWFVEALGLDENNALNRATHRLRVTSVLRGCPTIVQMWLVDHGIKYAAYLGDERKVLLPTTNHLWAVHDLTTGERWPEPKPFGRGHVNEAIAVSVDARRAVTTSTDGIDFWDLDSGQHLKTLAVEGAEYRIALSGDGALAAAPFGKEVRCYDTARGEPLASISRHGTDVTALCLDAEGGQLLTGQADGTVCLWRIGEATPVWTAKPHSSMVLFCAFSPDGDRVATSSYDRTARVFDVGKGTEVFGALRHTDAVWSVEFSPDSRRLVTCDSGFAVRLWEASTGESLGLLRHHPRPMYASFSSDQRGLLTCCYDGTVRAWELRDLQSQSLPAEGVPSAAGERVAVVEGRSVRLLDLGTTQTNEFLLPPTALPLRVWPAHQAERCLVLATNLQPAQPDRLWISMYDARSGGKVGSTIPILEEPQRVVLEGQDRWLAAVGRETVGVWRLADGQQVLAVEARVDNALFAPTGARLAFWDKHSLQTWEIGRERPWLSRDLTEELHCLRWNPAGDSLLLAYANNTPDRGRAEIVDAQTGRSRALEFWHRDGVVFADFSHNGGIVATCGEDFTTTLWDAATGEMLTTPLQHAHQVLHAAFSSDDRWLATACADGAARIWDAQTGLPLTPALQHADPEVGRPDPVVFVAWISADIALVTRTRSGRLRVWSLPRDVRSVEELRRMAELLSARKLHGARTMAPLSPEELRNRWLTLRAQYPEEFSAVTR